MAASLLVHAGVLALRFHAPDPPERPPVSSLEVVLLNARTDTEPVQATALAQVSMDGGGDSTEGLARSPLPPSPSLDSVIPTTTPEQRVQELEARQRDMMAQLASQYAALIHARSESAMPDGTPVPGLPDNTEQTLALLAQQYAAVSQRVEDYNRRPRRHFFAPSASAVPFAHYVEDWRQRVESIGNQYYPEAARGRVYGSLRMTVFVRADGSVEEVVFDAPSEHAVLNDAARDIIRKAAPFAPFPEDVRREADIIAITRTWHFQNDAISTEIP